MLAETSLSTALSETERREIIDRFFRDGFAAVRAVLSPGECDFLRRRTDELADDPATRDTVQHPGYSFVIINPLEHERAFADLFIREPIYSLVQDILGRECRFCGQTVIRNRPGQAVAHWHIDDILEYPLPESMPRWDARVRLPLTWLSVQVPLTDVTSPEDGPTEVVPGSQFSGRMSPKEGPVFEGRGAEPIFCKAGDIYLFNHQVWHRGRPNTSQRTRYLLQLQYARGDRIAGRCQGVTRTPALEATLRGGDPRVAEFIFRPPLT
jgi:ectoine hydroxylase-related dioxygenase (phytanoyl-CoA dioxygenase family)